jgi:FAD-dependent urate hydroxylase
MSRAVAAAVPSGRGVHVTFTDGTAGTFDHLLLGTGYKVDISQYSFLAPSLAARIRRAGGYPVLRPGMESSVPGLFFVGAPAAWSFGPIMRFVAGGWFGGQSVADAVARRTAPARDRALTAVASGA